MQSFSPQRPWKRLAAALMVGVVLLAAAGRLMAGSGGTVVLPSPGVKIRSGLQIRIYGQGVDANGYRPVRIEVSPLPAGPFPEDRQIRLVLKPNEYYGGRNTQVSQIIDLPEGSTTAHAVIAVPQTNQWNQLGVETYEGGDRLHDLSEDWLGWTNYAYGQWSEASPAILVVDSNVPARPLRDAQITGFQSSGADRTRTFTLPDVRTLAWIFPDPNRGFMGGAVAVGSSPAASGRLSDTELLTHVERNMNRVEMLPPAELSARWIDFSQYDVIIAAAAELQSLAANRPESLEAIRQWVRSGRVLIVTGAGEGFSGLGPIEKQLQLRPLPAAGDPEAPYRNWRRPDPKLSKAELQTSFDPAANNYQQMITRGFAVRQSPIPVGGTAGTTSEAPGTTTPPANATAAGEPPFVIRPAGLGVVVALSAKDPFPGKEPDWIWMFNSISKNQWMWFQREGFSLYRENDDYWTFLIPGVGEAPVISFLLLVSLFAVVIGPVNYVFLGRARRLYLLLLTVPAGALLVTLGLFTYAVLNDGLGVRLRSRSFADLDQTSGQAAGFSRLSYFAAVTPSRGLQFPEDATVFPIEYEPVNYGGPSQNTKQRMLWDGQQNLQRGYLSARTPTQFMVQRATKLSAKLIVREGGQSGQPPSVENRLDEKIRYLLLRDSRGNYFVGRGMKPAAEIVLEAISPAAAEKELASLSEPVKPDFPRGYDPALHHNSAISWLIPDFNRYYSGVDSGSSRPVMAASILESNLFLALRPTLQQPAPGSYLAVTEHSVVVPTGLPRSREEASLHVLRGRYQ